MKTTVVLNNEPKINISITTFFVSIITIFVGIKNKFYTICLSPWLRNSRIKADYRILLP